ncbi:MAG: chemotaxis protein CheR [Nitrospirae bacterium]|nr:chemotaxis protein CheR [Nitrospirota bacterium]
MAFTFFMRDLPVIEHAVNHTVQFSSGRMRTKVWDAGSALGQETYTVAIAFAEKMGRFALNNLRIDATDYDEANKFGDKVKNGVYHYDELKRMPEEFFKKYIEPTDIPGCYRVIDKLRNLVSFQYHDLRSFKPIGNDYSLILCKNVLLHFSQDERVKVIKMFHEALAPGGYFVTEHTQKLPAELDRLFEQVVPDAQLFRKL